MGADRDPPGQGENEAPPARRRFFSLRARLLGLVALMLVPWLVLVVYAQADERKAAIANVNDDAMRLIRIVTSNQAAQVEAARQLLTAFARLPQIQTKDGRLQRLSRGNAEGVPAVLEHRGRRSERQSRL